MTSPWRSLWREPRPDAAPPVGRLDQVLAAVFGVAALVEGILRPDLAWRPVVVLLGMTLVPALLLRRRHPLVACLVGFGVAGLLSLLQLVARTDDLGLASMMVVVVLLFSLVRWGSGREITLGLAFVGAVVAFSMYVAAAGPTDVVGGILLLLLVAALAALFRYRADLWHRRQVEIRNEERLALARELHDTVAHHVSAIAVQAQAGGILVGSRPDRAAEVLAAIEDEASRTLAEMRSMVRVLRDEDGRTTFAPQQGVAHLPALARTDTTPAVEVSITGAVTQLPRPVDAALYRLAQEGLTNALRHARDATQVRIEIRRSGAMTTLRVADDGRTDPGHGPGRGFGLTGMTERAQLLGGSLSAGPAPEGGWVVEVALPVDGPT